MKQYRITSEHFVTPGETGDADAFMAPDELAQLKKLAGVGSLGLLEDYTGAEAGPVQQSDATDKDMSSPLGGKDSLTHGDKRQIEKDQQIKAGSPEWFRLWFSKPWLTGEKPVGDSPAHKTIVKKSDDDQRS